MAAKKRFDIEDVKPKLIDGKALKKDDIKKITAEDLVADSIARKNKEAFNFVNEEANKKISRKGRKKENEQEMVYQPITSYRIKYLTKYTGYELKGETEEEKKARIKAEKEKARAAFFAKAEEYFN